MAEIEPISNALPPGWNASKDQNGNQYYYNKDQNVTQWSRPEFPGGGGGVAVGRGGGVGGGGSSGLGGGGMGGGGIVGGGAVGLNTAAIQMQMPPMPQMFQHVHVPVGARPEFTTPAPNTGPNAMPGGVVGRVDHSAAAQAMLKALRVNTSRDRASEPDCAFAVAALKPLLELANDKNALKRALESLKVARRNAIKESIKAALTDSGGSAQLGDIQNLLIMMHDDPTVAMDLIAEAYKEKVEAEQYAELLKEIHVYKQKLKPMSYKNHEGLPNMRLAAGWLGWWPVCNQNTFWVCHTQEGAHETGDPDDCCPCYRPPKPVAPPPTPVGGGWCCSEEEAPMKTKDIIGCTCMGTHCSCLMCHVIAEMVPFNWTEEKVYTIVEADNTPVICRTPKEVPKALTMGAMSPG